MDGVKAFQVNIHTVHIHRERWQRALLTQGAVVQEFAACKGTNTHTTHYYVVACGTDARSVWVCIQTHSVEEGCSDVVQVS